MGLASDNKIEKANIMNEKYVFQVGDKVIAPTVTVSEDIGTVAGIYPGDGPLTVVFQPSGKEMAFTAEGRRPEHGSMPTLFPAGTKIKVHTPVQKEENWYVMDEHTVKYPPAGFKSTVTGPFHSKEKALAFASGRKYTLVVKDETPKDQIYDVTVYPSTGEENANCNK